MSRRFLPRVPTAVLAALVAATPAAISLASTYRTGTDGRARHHHVTRPETTVDSAQGPAVSVSSGPTGSTNDPRPTFGFASPDSSATFSCSVDAGTANFDACSGANSHRPASNLADGSYTFRVKATDPAGNSTTATRTFSVDAQPSLDRTPPALAVVGDLANADGRPLDSSKADAEIEAIDDASGDSGIAEIEVTVDDVVAVTDSVDCTPSCPAQSRATYTYSESEWGDGSHTVTVTATDAVGNARSVVLEVGAPSPQAPVDAVSVTRAETDARAEKVAAAKQNGPPDAVPAWYMNATNSHDLLAAASDAACAVARRQPNTTRLVLLNFGQATTGPDGSFGARLTLGGKYFNNDKILEALTAAADSYRSRGCHTVGSAEIAYGNTNHMPDTMSRADAREAGRSQAATALNLLRYERQQRAAHPPSGGGYQHEGVAVAGDIEPGWNTPRITKDLVGAANDGVGGKYFDFGNVGPCDLPIQNGWDLGDLAFVSRAEFARPLPEIYDSCNAGQWNDVRKHWLQKHASGYRFHGVTSEPKSAGASLTPTEGWKKLNARSGGHVGRELVKIQYSR